MWSVDPIEIGPMAYVPEASAATFESEIASELGAELGVSAVDSASRCDQDVCIVVFGAGTRVERWYSRAKQYESDGCVSPNVGFLRTRPPDSTWWTLDYFFWRGPCQRAGRSGAYWYADLPEMPRFFRDNTRLGNDWSSPFAGLPSIEIKE